MKVKLVGYKELDFKTREGQEVKGLHLYTSFPAPDVAGEEIHKFYVSEANMELIAIDLAKSVGKQIDIELGLASKVLAVTAV